MMMIPGLRWSEPSGRCSIDPRSTSYTRLYSLMTSGASQSSSSDDYDDDAAHNYDGDDDDDDDNDDND